MVKTFTNCCNVHLLFVYILPFQRLQELFFCFLCKYHLFDADLFLFWGVIKHSFIHSFNSHLNNWMFQMYTVVYIQDLKSHSMNF